MGAICSSSHSGVSAHKEMTFLSISSNLQDIHATSYIYRLQNEVSKRGKLITYFHKSQWMKSPMVMISEDDHETKLFY
jgi:hypothetical protein